MQMAYKFEKLEIWSLALEYIDLIYKAGAKLPASEEYNLKSQITRAPTSIALNIAEGSTSQSDAEQRQFIKISIRSLLESVACLHLMVRRDFIEKGLFTETYNLSELLFAKLQAFRNALSQRSAVIGRRS